MLPWRWREGECVHTNISTNVNRNKHTTHSYELMSLCASAEACMRALLGYDLPQMDSALLERAPHSAAVASAEKTIAYHSECVCVLLLFIN